MSEPIYISREITSAIIEAARYFPVITLTGPRQSGKSTLLRHSFPDLPYISMENPDVRTSALEDPNGFLAKYHSGVLIDEVQRVPQLLSYIQTIVDEHPDRKFYLTGSSNFSLLKNVTQSLAGRSAIFELLPLSLPEISTLTEEKSLDSILYDGFFPAVWSDRNIPKLLYPNYIRSYLERDVRDLLNVRDIDAFRRFLRLCAGRIGSIFNASELANEVGVAVNTINAWLSVLQASYIIYLLPPFFTNTRKRLTKSPKIYFTDTGLASRLLDIDSPDVMSRDKMRGHLFENMIVIEALKRSLNKGKEPSLYFYRDSNGNEVDLLIRKGAEYLLFEIKSALTFHPDFTKGLASFSREFPQLVIDQSVIYAGQTLGNINGVNISNYRNSHF